MHIVLIRHGTRIDKAKPGISPEQSEVSLLKTHKKEEKKPVSIEEEFEMESANWLSNFDPPLNQVEASQEMESAFKKISNKVLAKDNAYNIVIHSSPYNRCIQTSELILDKLKKRTNHNDKRTKIKLRVDQGLSEWLNENYNLSYLPPNDDGYSMINNVNAYLNMPTNEENCKGDFSRKTREQLRNVKDPTWSYNQLGHCGEYGESASSFTRRCYQYLIQLLQFYYTRQDLHADKHTVVFVVSHGAVISTLLQILLGRSVFNEIPLCTPIYFKQSEKRRSIFKLMDYDFNLFKLLSPSSDQEFYSILQRPIDLTKLDPENLRSELTIGTSGYTTIIQSISKKAESTNLLPSIPLRKRRNTIDLCEKNDLFENNIEELKQTRSSRQLYLLNKDTKEEKVIDLNKLHSYFGGSDSESDSGSGDEVRGKEIENIISVNDFDDNGASLKENIHKGSITSLSSFNEENKSKFQLNMKNFYSKEEPIQSDPYSHFFLNRSGSNAESDGFEFDGLCMSRRASMLPENNDQGSGFKEIDDFGGSKISNHTNNAKPIFSLNILEDDSTLDEDSELSDDEYSDNENILSFGTKRKIASTLVKNEMESSTGSFGKGVESRSGSATILNGTYKNRSINSLNGIPYGESTSLSNEKLTTSKSGGLYSGNLNIKLGVPKLISTRNSSLHVRGNESEETADISGDTKFAGGGNNINNVNNNNNNDNNRTELSLRKQLFGSTNSLGANTMSFRLGVLDEKSDSESEDESDADGGKSGWFGGFSR